MKPFATLLTIAVVFSCLVSTAQADRKSREEEKARQQRLERQLRDVSIFSSMKLTVRSAIARRP